MKKAKEVSSAVKIHNEVIAAVASSAAREVEGVLRMSSGGFVGGLVGALSKKEFDRGVKVEGSHQGETKVSVSIIVKYGVNIPEVGAQVQKRIKEALNKMVGISKAEVKVNIKGVEKVK